MSIQGCPCCTQILLRHIRRGKIYWFCVHCHQEMPVLNLQVETKRLMLERLRIKLLLAPKISPLYTWWKVSPLVAIRNIKDQNP